MSSLYEEGPVVKAVGGCARVPFAHLSMAFSGEGPGRVEGAGGPIHTGSSSDQMRCGACRGEGLVLGEHVPDGGRRARRASSTRATLGPR